MLALDHFKTADAAADVNADAFGHFFGCDPEAGSGKRIFGSGDGHLDEAAHFLDLFFLDEAGRIEMLDLAGDAAVESGCIERFNVRDTAAAFEQRLPCLLSGIADRGELPNTGNYDSAGNRWSPLTLFARLANAGRPGDKAECPNGSAKRAFPGLRRPGSRLFFLAFNISDGVSDSGDLLGVFVGDFHFEGLFERHYQFDDVQRIGAQIVDE
jgi:hypothetical protein